MAVGSGLLTVHLPRSEGVCKTLSKFGRYGNLPYHIRRVQGSDPATYVGRLSIADDFSEYVVTYRGRPVAVILPMDTEQAEAEMVEVCKRAVLGDWERYEQLAEEIRRAWPSDVSTQDLVDAIRR